MKISETEARKSVTNKVVWVVALVVVVVVLSWVKAEPLYPHRNYILG